MVDKKNAQNRKKISVLGIEVRGKKGIQMVLNKLLKQRFDHTIVVEALKILIDEAKNIKWDDTNFITFEALVRKKVSNIRSSDRRMDYQLIWQKYLKMKQGDPVGVTVAMFGDDVARLLEAPEEYARGGGYHGMGLSVGK